MDGKKKKQRGRKKGKKPNWAKKKPGRKKKKKWMEPRIGRSRYDQFRGDEVLHVSREIADFVDRERIHEKRLGCPGRPPMKKRDIIKSLLFLELFRCRIQKSPSMLEMHKDLLGLENIPKPRTLYKYRAMPEMSGILERLQKKSADELWEKEYMAATDGTGNPRSKGKHWRMDRDNSAKYREYDKAHYMVGVKSLVIPYTRVTRGTWSDLPEFEPLVRNTIPGSNIKQVLADKGYVSNDNYEVATECGATPYIMPKDNAVYRPHPSNHYQKMVHFATKFPKRFKDVYRYRVKVECAIHSKKNAFGEVFRGKSPSSRRNQELLQDIVHNFRMTVMDRHGN